MYVHYMFTHTYDVKILYNLASNPGGLFETF